MMGSLQLIKEQEMENTMENSEYRKRYLEIYRQQLRREMDAMGYGQPRESTPNFERQARTRSTSYGVIAAFALTLLGPATLSGFFLFFASISSQYLK